MKWSVDYLRTSPRDTDPRAQTRGLRILLRCPEPGVDHAAIPAFPRSDAGADPAATRRSIAVFFAHSRHSCAMEHHHRRLGSAARILRLSSRRALPDVAPHTSFPC